MAATTVYPDWVQSYREKGTTIKKVGNNFYLYKHSSKRVPGKKYPVPVDTYIGKITPNGVEKEQTKRKVGVGDVEVKELGFSRALEQLCPQSWKEPLGKDWQRTLDFIILRESPETYIAKTRGVVTELDSRIQIGAQIGMLNKRMRRDYGIDIKDLKILKTIYAVYIGKKTMISKTSAEQEALIKKLGISMEVK